eukprot:10077282-Prorocentrum_lima.AAC.1
MSVALNHHAGDHLGGEFHGHRREWWAGVVGMKQPESPTVNRGTGIGQRRDESEGPRHGAM